MLVVRNLLSVAVSGMLLSVAVDASPVLAQSSSLAADSVFIQQASSSGLLQVKLGQLAEKKGTSPAVVEFGKRMVADYSKANQELKSAAKQAAFPAPVLLRQDQQVFDRFNGLGRSSFDKAYMSEMVKQHGEELRLYQRESSGGRVKSLKELASRMLPDLQQRLSLATETGESVGADVTASKSDAGEKAGSY